MPGDLMSMAIGSTLGRYQIVAQLGSGGMATVYKAFQPALDRFVALKVLRPGLIEDPEQRERFEREAKAIARLRHPNIVQVFDFDTIETQSFLVLEFVDGGTLKAKLTELGAVDQRLPRGEADRIVREVAEALDVAHSHGIVHRDVKPSNVLLSRSGRAVMADFGIARMLAATQQTQTGVGVGTPEYMSPEQGQGGTVDQQSDIYSLGVMAFELIVGRVPFKADTPLAVVLAHVRDPLPMPTSIDPTVGPAVEQVLLKALAKDPKERWASAGAFASALSAAIAKPLGEPQAAPAPAPAASAAASPAAAPAAAAAAPAQPRPAAARKPAIDATRAARSALRWQIELVARLLSLLFVILELLLVARFALKVASLIPEPGFAATIYGLTDPIVSPFADLAASILAAAPDPSVATRIDAAALLALVAVFIVSRIVDPLAKLLIRSVASSRY